MKTVRAKFRVQSVTKREHWDKTKPPISTIEMSPVVSGSPENEAFYAASPSGTVQLGTVNTEAAAAFELGREYYVDFTPAPTPFETPIGSGG